jgi:hypothetical protein
MNKWWQNPLLGTDDDEGAYDYYAEELPQDKSQWSRYPCKCDDCGKERRLHRTDYHYFYCWDGWDSMDYTTCWKCHIKNVIRSSVHKIKKYIRNCITKLDIGAYIMFRKFCKKHNIHKDIRKDMWAKYYDVWHDKAIYKLTKGVK